MALAKWWRIDFHTHTPASKCFKNSKAINTYDEDRKIEEAKKWLLKAKENKLDAVAITDHNSVAWIDRIRKAKEKLKTEYKNEKFPIIFPGVELSVSTNKIHILVIFSPNISQSNLNSFMSICQILEEDFGDTNRYITEEDLIKAIKKFKIEKKENILVIPAHFYNTKGAGKELADTNVLETFMKRLDIDGIEIRDLEGYKRVNDYINKGILPNVGTIIGSDNPGVKEGEHHIDGIGSKYSWIKMSDISLEGIRQALLDPESRILNVEKVDDNQDNPNQVEHSYISGIEIKRLKHINNINIRLSPNLNCIVGPRGSGKSTLIESIKVAIDNATLSNTKILSKTYQKDSEINLYYNFGDNSKYLINTKKVNTKLEIKVDSEQEKNISNPPKFNSTIFGQKEIYNLVDEDINIDTNDISPILKQIDNNITHDKTYIDESIINKLDEIKSLVKDLQTSKKKLSNLSQVKSEVEKTSNRLEKFRTTGILEKKEKLDKLENQFNNIRESVNLIYEIKSNLTKELELKLDNYKDLDIDKNEKLINELNESVSKELDIIKQKLFIFNTESNQMFKSISNCILNSNLNKEINNVKKEYEKIIDDNKEIDVTKYKELVIEDKKNRDNLIKLEQELSQLSSIKQNIKQKIDEYVEELGKLTQKRNEVVDEINSKAENISLSIEGLSNGERWLKEIRKELGKKDSFESSFRSLYDALFPQDKIDIAKYKEWLMFLLTSETGDITDICSEIKDQKFKAIWNDKCKTNTLSSLFEIKLEDKININIVNGKQELNILDGSPGQKSASILAFILSQGNDPLIIDQPEDDLDNSLIIKLVVDNIRKQKQNRQIIIVTHNPNIPVLGDAEGIIMLDRDESGSVSLRDNKKAGCIEEKTIKSGICDIMEGGIEAFKRRESKYKNIN